jgi:hypothetical protein
VVSVRDTTPDAAAVRIAVYRRMTDEQRVHLGVELSESARVTALAAIRSRHPDYDEAQARLALFRLLLGDDLFRRAWPSAPLVSP